MPSGKKASCKAWAGATPEPASAADAAPVTRWVHSGLVASVTVPSLAPTAAHERYRLHSTSPLLERREPWGQNLQVPLAHWC